MGGHCPGGHTPDHLLSYKDGSYAQFASLRMKLAWLAHSRPDCLYEISQMTQVTCSRFEDQRREIVRRVNKTVQYAKDNPAAIRIPRLELETWHVLGISDASFASNYDATSHLGFVCFLADATGNVIPIHFKSNKARRVTRSVMGAELIAFGDLFDHAFTLSAELRSIHPGAPVPVKLLTDNKSLFDVISKGSKTSEKRLMLDIAGAREGFGRHEISDIRFLRSEDNISDGMTKRMKQSALREMMQTSNFVPRVEQWIVRSPPDPEY